MKRLTLFAAVIILVQVSLIGFLVMKKLKLSTIYMVRIAVQPSPSSPAFINRDYILNFSGQIKPPLQCIPIRTVLGRIPICVHDNPDEYVSRQIRKSATWEDDISSSVQNILVANPDYGVVDIGANLGMFSLLAANLQIPVLAVEAMDINIEKFHQSIVINHFEKYITLVTRPLSDKHETLRLVANITNLGMSRLVKSSHHQKIIKVTTYHEKNKTALLLDELIDLMPRKKAIMMVDVEGNEGKVIRGGQKFFDAVHISHVFMEWFNLSHMDRQFLVEFFIKRGYKPYKGPSFKSNLRWSAFARWPPNVFWRKH